MSSPLPLDHHDHDIDPAIRTLSDFAAPNVLDLAQRGLNAAATGLGEGRQLQRFFFFLARERRRDADRAVGRRLQATPLIRLRRH